MKGCLKVAVVMTLFLSLSGCIVYSNRECQCTQPQKYHQQKYLNGTRPVQAFVCPYHRRYMKNCGYCEAYQQQLKMQQRQSTR